MKLKGLITITRTLLSLNSFAKNYRAQCEAGPVTCELKSKYVLGEACQCESKGKMIAGKIRSVSEDNDLTPGIFKSSKIVGDYLCGEKFGDFNFEQEYGTLFSSTYLNKNVAPRVTAVSADVKTQMENICKKEHSLVGWSVQGCYDSCYKSFKKDDEFREQCYATCTSLKDKAESLTTDVAALIDSNKLNADACEKSVKVNESSRDKIKKGVEHSTTPTTDQAKGAVK